MRKVPKLLPFHDLLSALSTLQEKARLDKMAYPKLTHAFDLVIWGPPGFTTSATSNSNLCCANGTLFLLLRELLTYLIDKVEGGKLSSSDGNHEFTVKCGSDWMIVPAGSRTITIDARISAEKADGTNLELAYLGKMAITDEIRTLFDGSSAARETRFGEPYYYTTPRIWSRSDEFAWG